MDAGQDEGEIGWICAFGVRHCPEIHVEPNITRKVGLSSIDHLICQIGRQISIDIAVVRPSGIPRGRGPSSTRKGDSRNSSMSSVVHSADSTRNVDREANVVTNIRASDSQIRSAVEKLSRAHIDSIFHGCHRIAIDITQSGLRSDQPGKLGDSERITDL